MAKLDSKAWKAALERFKMPGWMVVEDSPPARQQRLIGFEDATENEISKNAYRPLCHRCNGQAEVDPNPTEVVSCGLFQPRVPCLNRD